jgi:hypothetical protein
MSDVQRYWAGVLQRLRAEVDVLSKLVEHYGERGRANELALAQVLERFLPTRWGVGTGMLVDRHGRQSRQMDLVIFERSDEPALFAQTTLLLFPIETVIACIEVKTTLTSRDVTDDFVQKSESLAELDPADGYPRPIFALVAYDCEPSPQALTELFGPSQAPELACVLNWCLLAGTGGVLQSDEGYVVGSCLRRRDRHGNTTDAPVQTDARDRHVMEDGMVVPVVRHSDGTRYVGDPGRALLLFVEALTRVGAIRRGRPAPILSHYLDADARRLDSLTAGV